jgi:hypothetical protein
MKIKKFENFADNIDLSQRPPRTKALDISGDYPEFTETDTTIPTKRINYLVKYPLDSYRKNPFSQAIVCQTNISPDFLGMMSGFGHHIDGTNGSDSESFYYDGTLENPSNFAYSVYLASKFPHKLFTFIIINGCNPKSLSKIQRELSGALSNKTLRTLPDSQMTGPFKVFLQETSDEKLILPNNFGIVIVCSKFSFGPKYSDLVSKLDFVKDVDYSEIESPEELFSYKLSDEEKKNL